MWIEKFIKTNKKVLCLAPMADMTDSPFCEVVRGIGGCDVVFREMVSSEALVRDNEKTMHMAEFKELERPIVQQIFGSDPVKMARAAEMIMEKFSPDGIDINMGCPAYKIVGNFNGCALMKDPDLAKKIVLEVKKVVSVPVSVKIRLGWSSPDEFKTFIPVLESAGVDLISLHGRTKTQGYSGVSDWERIRQAKEIAKVPLLANGDISAPGLVSECLKKTGADGVLIGRGALGNPWFFSLSLNNREISLEERIKIIVQHAKLHVAHYGEKSIVTFRKHLLWYFKANKFEGIEKLKELKAKLVQVSTIVELEEILNSIN